eukprot:PRCOL_00001486-RA
MGDAGGAEDADAAPASSSTGGYSLSRDDLSFGARKSERFVTKEQFAAATSKPPNKWRTAMENSPGGIVVSSAVGVGVVVTTLLLCYDFFVIGGPPVKIGASAVGILTIVQAVNAVKAILED